MTITSTVDYVGFHAAAVPEKIAIVVNGESITYAALYQGIGKMVVALRRIGLHEGQTAAIETSNAYLHWLILLAFDALGIGTLSYDPAEAPFIEETLVSVNLVMCAPGREPAGAKRVHCIDQAWADSVAAQPPGEPIVTCVSDPAAPFRIVKSSGTTGTPKAMVQSRAVFEARLMRAQYHAGYRAETRYLVAMGFSVQAYHLAGTGCLRAGGTCVFENRKPLAATLAEQAITDISLLPRTLNSLLDGMAGMKPKHAGLKVFTIGAPVTKAVHARAADVLGATLFEAYSTNEAGAICRMNKDGTGTIIPGIRVDVVDDAETPILGKPGRVRVQGDGCISGYLNDPEADRKMFRNGWFYPGDVAIQHDSRRLTIVGRADDLLNIQGIKYAPQALEEKLVAALPIADACIAVVDDAHGVAKVWVVVVPNDKIKIADIQPTLTSMLPPLFGSVSVVALNAIPRTPTAKVRRAVLNQVLRKMLTT